LITVDGTSICILNCPPANLKLDPDDPTFDVIMSYQWYDKSLAPVSSWGSSIPSSITLDCAAVLCTKGSAYYIKSRACDVDDGLCTESAPSIWVKVRCSKPGEFCNAKADCCGGSDCDTGACKAISGSPVSGDINWLYFIYALLAVILTLALAYMASYAFSIPSLRAIVQDELVQVMATGALIFLLFGLQILVDQHLTGLLAGSNGVAGATNMMDASQLKLDDLSEKTSKIMEDTLYAGGVLGQNASKSVFCNFLGVGFSIANCSPLNAFRGSMTLATISSGMALADLYAQKYLLSMAKNFAFTLLLPLGLFLRCFKVTRGAGGALIAVGFGFYSVYPTVIVATDNLLHGTSPPIVNTAKLILKEECNPVETNVETSYIQIRDYARQITDFDMNEGVVYNVLVRVVFMSILNLIITLGFIRAFARIIGSEIDVSSLARIS
jgi:hypothetical protein